MLSALAAKDVTKLRILDVSTLHLECSETLDALKTILLGAAESLTHLSITACAATVQAFGNASLRNLSVLHLSCASDEPMSFACACLSQLSRHWEEHCPDVIELEQGNAPLLSDGMQVPPCLSCIQHLQLDVHDSGDSLSKALSFLTRCHRLERLTLTAHPDHAEITELKRACKSLSDVRLHLRHGCKPLDAALFRTLSGCCMELDIETPVAAADWAALSVMGGTLRKLTATVAPDGLPEIRDFLLHADVLEELLIRNISNHGDPEEVTLNTDAWDALADGIAHVGRLTHLDIGLVDNDQGLVVAMPNETVDGVVKVMQALGDRAKRFVVELTLTAFADDAVYRAMLRIMRTAAECMPFVETFDVDVYSTLVNEDWETSDRGELMQMLRDVIDAAEQLETKLSCVQNLNCCSCREDIAKLAKQALKDVEQSDVQ